MLVPNSVIYTNESINNEEISHASCFFKQSKYGQKYKSVIFLKHNQEEKKILLKYVTYIIALFMKTYKTHFLKEFFGYDANLDF